MTREIKLSKSPAIIQLEKAKAEALAQVERIKAEMDRKGQRLARYQESLEKLQGDKKAIQTKLNKVKNERLDPLKQKFIIIKHQLSIQKKTAELRRERLNKARAKKREAEVKVSEVKEKLQKRKMIAIQKQQEYKNQSAKVIELKEFKSKVKPTATPKKVSDLYAKARSEENVRRRNGKIYLQSLLYKKDFSKAIEEAEAYVNWEMCVYDLERRYRGANPKILQSISLRIQQGCARVEMIKKKQHHLIRFDYCEPDYTGIGAGADSDESGVDSNTDAQVAVDSELQDAQQMEGQLESEKDEAQSDLQEAQTDYQQADASYQDSSTEADSLEKQTDCEDEKTSGLEDQLAGVSDQTESAENEVNQLQNQSDATDQQLKDQQERTEQASADYNSAQSDLDAAQSKLDSISDDLVTEQANAASEAVMDSYYAATGIDNSPEGDDNSPRADDDPLAASKERKDDDSPVTDALDATQGFGDDQEPDPDARPDPDAQSDSGAHSDPVTQPDSDEANGSLIPDPTTGTSSFDSIASPIQNESALPTYAAAAGVDDGDAIGQDHSAVDQPAAESDPMVNDSERVLSDAEIEQQAQDQAYQEWAQQQTDDSSTTDHVLTDAEIEQQAQEQAYQEWAQGQTDSSGQTDASSADAEAEPQTAAAVSDDLDPQMPAPNPPPEPASDASPTSLPAQSLESGAAASASQASASSSAAEASSSSPGANMYSLWGSSAAPAPAAPEEAKSDSVTDTLVGLAQKGIDAVADVANEIGELSDQAKQNLDTIKDWGDHLIDDVQGGTNSLESSVQQELTDPLSP